MLHQAMLDKIIKGNGFIAALDQSGGSTPKALGDYGIPADAWSNDAEMYDLIHQVRVRIITSPVFTGDKVLGAILFERTLDGHANGKPVPEVLRDRGIVPFVKIDRGLQHGGRGVQLMKPISQLNALLSRAKPLGIFGTKERSVIHLADRQGIADVVKQQLELGQQVLAAGLVPMIEPEVSILSPERTQADLLLLEELLRALDTLPNDSNVMLKLSIPTQPGTFDPLVDHPRVLRVVALSGGFSRAEACAELAKNRGIIASFSRALLTDLRHLMSSTEFDHALASAIDEIYRASTQKV